MNMMSFTLSDSLKSFIDEQVAEHAFATGDDYVRQLIAREYDRERLRRLVQNGIDSPPAGEMDDVYFDDLKARIRNSARG